MLKPKDILEDDSNCFKPTPRMLMLKFKLKITFELLLRIEIKLKG